MTNLTFNLKLVIKIAILVNKQYIAAVKSIEGKLTPCQVLFTSRYECDQRQLRGI